MEQFVDRCPIRSADDIESIRVLSSEENTAYRKTGRKFPSGEAEDTSELDGFVIEPGE